MFPRYLKYGNKSYFKICNFSLLLMHYYLFEHNCTVTYILTGYFLVAIMDSSEDYLKEILQHVLSLHVVVCEMTTDNTFRIIPCHKKRTENLFIQDSLLRKSKGTCWGSRTWCKTHLCGHLGNPVRCHWGWSLESNQNIVYLIPSPLLLECNDGSF